MKYFSKMSAHFGVVGAECFWGRKNHSPLLSPLVQNQHLHLFSLQVNTKGSHSFISFLESHQFYNSVL